MSDRVSSNSQGRAFNGLLASHLYDYNLKINPQASL